MLRFGPSKSPHGSQTLYEGPKRDWLAYFWN